MKRLLKTVFTLGISLWFIVPIFINTVSRTFLFVIIILLVIFSLYVGMGNKHTHGGFAEINIHIKNSRLANINPFIKIIFALIMMFLAIASKGALFPLFLSAVMFIITCLAGKIDVHYYISLLFVPILFLFMSGIVLLFDISNSPIGFFNIHIFSVFLTVTKENRDMALLITSRAFGALSSMYMLSLSTNMTEIAKVFNKCGLKLIAELVYLIYRYIFILIEMQRNMTASAESRLGYHDYKKSISTFSLIASNLFALSLRRASDSFNAMESRCYDGNLEFITYKEKKITIPSILCFAGLTLFFGMVFWGLNYAEVKLC